MKQLITAAITISLITPVTLFAAEAQEANTKQPTAATKPASNDRKAQKPKNDSTSNKQQKKCNSCNFFSNLFREPYVDDDEYSD